MGCEEAGAEDLRHPLALEDLVHIQLDCGAAGSTLRARQVAVTGDAPVAISRRIRTMVMLLRPLNIEGKTPTVDALMSEAYRQYPPKFTSPLKQTGGDGVPLR